MITPSEEYKNQLWRFQYGYYFVGYNLRIPEEEPIFTVDLNTRKINAPATLGVVEDHQSERVFFEIDRDCNGIDLAETVGIIVFKNAKNETYAYLIPEYNLTEKPGKLIFSWLLQAPLTKYPGQVQFMIKFFRVNKNTKAIEFELNTQIAQSKILDSWTNVITGEDSQYQILLDPALQNLFIAMQNAIDNGYFDLYWTDL